MLKENRFTLADALMLALVAVASIIGINQYTYGMYNHFVTIPFIKNLVDPTLFPNDYLVVEQKYFYTYFNTAFAFLSKSLNISLPVLFFTFYCVSLYVTLIAFFKIALTLFREKTVAYFSIILVIFSFNTLGNIRTIESLFLERALVLPLLLFGIYFFLHKKFILTYVLAGVAFLFHPLSAVYMLAGIGLCSLIFIKEIGWKKLAISLALLVLIISPVLYLKKVNPAPSLSLFHPDQEWLDLLMLRSSHHIWPSTWGKKILLQAFLFVIGFVLCMRYKPEAWHHRVVLVFCSAILLLCVAGTIFTELMPVSIIVQFQLFRGFVFLIYFGMIYYANYLFRESGEISPSSIVVLLCLAPIYFDEKTFSLVNVAKFAGFLGMLFCIYPGFGIVQKHLPQLKRFYLPALVMALLVLGVAGGILKKNFTIQTAQDKNWLDVQVWAKSNTPKDAIFIVSPSREGFRVESERSSYVDFKDGTQMFFNPEFGKEWIRRMNTLGFDVRSKMEENFLALNLEDFEKIAAELTGNSEVFIILTPLPGKKTLPLTPVYTNAEFTVYKLKG